MPTTAGTGSEVGRAAVLTNPATREKKIIFHRAMLPEIVISDPELIVGLPAALTAGTGMDAFAHCLEAYSAPRFHPFSHGIAVVGLRIIKTFLPRAFADGTDIEARGQMMAAAAMGATAFQKGLGAVHALSHPIGATYGTHHGTTNAVILPHVLAMNRRAIEGKIVTLARYLDIGGGFDGFLDFVVGGPECATGHPASLSELGVAADDGDRLVAQALVDPSIATNPVKMTEANTMALLRACL